MVMAWTIQLETSIDFVLYGRIHSVQPSLYKQWPTTLPQSIIHGDTSLIHSITKGVCHTTNERGRTDPKARMSWKRGVISGVTNNVVIFILPQRSVSCGARKFVRHPTNLDLFCDSAMTFSLCSCTTPSAVPRDSSRRASSIPTASIASDENTEDKSKKEI
jgi:hypothetical protein